MRRGEGVFRTERGLWVVKRLLLVMAVMVGIALALCVVGVKGEVASPVLLEGSSCVVMPSTFVFVLRCDGLTKAATPSGISSRYVITNLAASTATTSHDFYLEGTDWQLDPPVSNIMLGIDAHSAAEFDLGDVSMPGGDYYVIVMADQPITGTVLPMPVVKSPAYVFLPFVIKQPPPPPPEPLVRGETVRFLGVWEDVPLEGKVVSSEYRTVLVEDYSGPVYPYGIFVVAVMDIANVGLVGDQVGLYDSFRVKDSVGRQFDIAELEVLWAAEDEYNLESVYETIQPGFTRRLVFVFDVLPASEGLHLISLSPW